MIIAAWPYPRFIQTQFHVFLLCINSFGGTIDLYELSLVGSTWNGTLVGSLGNTVDIDFVDIADFGPFYVVTTLGSTGPITFLRDPAVSLGDPDALVEDTSNSFGTCCNFKQVFVGGNFVDIADTATNGVKWSGIGNYEFDPQADPTSGKSVLAIPFYGNSTPVVHRVLPLQDGVAVYSDGGNVLLEPALVESTATFGQKRLEGLGIASGYHVAGDEDVHGFINLNFDFWLLQNGGKLTKRGHRPQIRDLAQEAEPLVVSYLPRDHRFYISNGLRCLVVNDFGAFTCHQCPSSALVGADGVIYGIFADNGDREARILSDPTDFNSRGYKTIESAVAGVITDNDVYLSSLKVEYSMTNDDDYHALPWKPGGPRSEAVLRSTALIFRVGVKVNEYLGTQIQSLDVNVKFPDNRFRRGIAAQTTGEVRQQQGS